MENKGFSFLVGLSVALHAVVLYAWTAPVFTPPVVDLEVGEMSVALTFVPEEPREEPVEIVEEPVEVVEEPVEELVKEPVKEVIIKRVEVVPAVAKEPVDVQPVVASVASVGVLIDPRPRELMNKPPVYPSHLGRRLHKEAVLLEVEILPDGRVGDVSIEKGCRYTAANKAVLKAVRKWRYHPAKLDGVPVRALHKERFVFEYRQGRRGAFARD